MVRGMRAWSDAQVEQCIGTLLRTGVMIAAAVVLFGGCLYVIRYGGALPAYRVCSMESRLICVA